jgi:predicted HicB family RNase H-like nuclease
MRMLKFDMDVEAYKSCGEMIEDDDQVIICNPHTVFRTDDGTEFEAQLQEGQQFTFYKSTLKELADGKVPDVSAYVNVSMKATVRVKESLVQVKNLVRV